MTAAAAALLLLSWMAPTAPPAAAAPAPALRIASADSRAEFSLRVAWVRRLRGKFGQIDGTVQPLGAERYRVEVALDVASLRMRNPAHAAWARSDEFFAAARYPQIRFVADKVPQALLHDGGALRGELSLRGVTRLVQFSIAAATCARPGHDCPIRVDGEVRRSAFGMASRHWILSDKVKLRFRIRLAAPSR